MSKRLQKAPHKRRYKHGQQPINTLKGAHCHQKIQIKNHNKISLYTQLYVKFEISTCERINKLQDIHTKNTIQQQKQQTDMQQYGCVSETAC